MGKRFRTQLGVLAFYLAFSFLIYYFLSQRIFKSHLNLTINTSKHTPHCRHSAKPFGPRRQDWISLPPSVFKSSIIGGLRANDEVGSAARERPQMKSFNGMCIITSSTNHQRSSAVRRRLHHRQPPPPIHVGLCRGYGAAHD